MDEFKASKLNTQLAAARAVIAESGKSPRELGKASRLKVLEWIYRWGYTSSSVGQLLLNRTSGGYMQKLTKHNWLVATKTKSGMPSSFFSLSKIGLEESERHSVFLSKYAEIDPYRIDQLKIRHNLIAQTSTINAMHTGLITNYLTERMFGNGGDKSGVKRPDVVWITKQDRRYGIEIELSAKWGMDLDEFILKIAQALQTKNNEAESYSRFVVISDSPAIITRYQHAMQPSKPLNIWGKSDRGHWVIRKTIAVPDWLINMVDFQLIEN